MSNIKSGKNLMTEGSVSSKIIGFAVPLFLGNLFQQLYNTVDSLIVGNFLGSDALAAVSTAGNLIFFMIGFVYGLSQGAGVVIARYIGAKDSKSTQIAVHTTISLGLFCSILLTILGTVLAPQILVLMGTPDTVLPQSVTYFRIYFAGATSFVMYNICVGILQAAGDSKHPLQYLVTSSIINIILDITFIRILGFGVGGASLATVIAQSVSVILCIKRLIQTDDDYRLIPSKIRFHGPTLSKIIQYGLPSGFQNSIIGFANVVVQSHINYFGDMAMAGAGAYSKIEGFAFLPITSFTMALTTFVSQNIGAGRYDRVKKGAIFGAICSVSLAELIGITIYFLAPTLISAFDRTPEVIAFGTSRARICALFYCLLSFSHVMSSILRGAGRSVIPMIIMLICWCIIRVSILVISSQFVRDINIVNSVYPITWALSSICFTVYFKVSHILSPKMATA
ncbi:MAG: MATE family efflux transporter [Butyrivibrio sp.]|nr:MATE family efflux transporter [Butyrivibrio sp.]